MRLLHALLLAAGSAPWGKSPSDSSYSSCRSSFGFSGSCAQCRVSSTRKAPCFPGRIPCHPHHRCKGGHVDHTAEHHRFQSVLMGPGQLPRFPLALTLLNSHPSSFLTAHPEDFCPHHQTQKKSPHITV